MELSLSSAQIDLQNSVRRFCKDWYPTKPTSPDGIARTGDTGQSRRERWEMLGSLGWIGAALPDDMHGANATAVECAIIQEEFGKALSPDPYWCCAVMAGHLINQVADRTKSKSLFAAFTSGRSIVAVAHTETDTYCYEGPVRAVAEDSPNGDFFISGCKTMVFGGPTADLLLVSARLVSRGQDAEGIFALPSSLPGISRRDYELLDGSTVSDFDLVRVRVDGEALLGPPEHTRPALDFAADQALAALCAEAIGVIDSVLWKTRDFLKLRRQYGVILSSLQALQHRMADMFVEAELARSIVLHAIKKMSESDGVLRRKGVLAAHVHIAKSGMFVCKNGVQLHGAIGATDDHIIAKYFRRMIIISRLFGGPERQLQRYEALL